MYGIEVKNLLPHVDVAELCDVFREYGKIMSARVLPGNSTMGYVYYKDFESMIEALKHGNKQCIMLGTNTGVVISRVGLLSDANEKKTNLYVKNFSLDWDDCDLLKLFDKYGEIQSASVECDKYGNSKGFGFINFKNQHSADLAIAKLHDRVLNGKKLYVQPHQTKEERKSVVIDAIQEAKEALERSTQLNNLYVANLAPTVTEDTLKDLFSQFGKILSLKIERDSRSNSRGFGFVCFESAAQAKEALQAMDGYSLNRKELQVNFKQGRAEREYYLKLKKEGIDSTRPVKESKATTPKQRATNYKTNHKYYSIDFQKLGATFTHT